ncbi:MAG: adenosine kinase [Myxococcota bacterium]
MTYDLAGVGNALMDALVVIQDDSVLGDLHLARGGTHMVAHDDWEKAYDCVRQLKVTFDSGGSCANTVATVGLLGGKAVFCGQVGDDQMGRMYGAKLDEACGQHALRTSTDAPTGKCLAIISETDAERTMVTDLGAAVSLHDLGDFDGVLKSTQIGHFEGYMLMDPVARQMVIVAMEQVRKSGGRVSLDVNDPFVINAITDVLRDLIRTHVDIVFLNEDEARALTGQDPEQAVNTVADELGVRTVVVKMGKRGSLVKHDGTVHTIGVRTVKAIDTTGAGDAYAGGYLYGMAKGWGPDQCGDLAAAVAALTVSQIGAVVKDRIALERVLESVQS